MKKIAVLYLFYSSIVNAGNIFSSEKYKYSYSKMRSDLSGLSIPISHERLNGLQQALVVGIGKNDSQICLVDLSVLAANCKYVPECQMRDLINDLARDKRAPLKGLLFVKREKRFKRISEDSMFVYPNHVLEEEIAGALAIINQDQQPSASVIVFKQLLLGQQMIFEKHKEEQTLALARKQKQQSRKVSALERTLLLLDSRDIAAHN